MRPTTTEAAPRAGATHAAAIVAGSMLGVGIFVGPPQVAAHVSSVAWFVALWVLGGLAALSGAAAVAELGAMMPRSGGDYIYLREAYGEAVAFVVLFPLPELAAVGEAGTAAARKLFGAAGVTPVTLLISLAILASINGTVLGGARVTHAMAAHHHFFRCAGSTDRLTGAPGRALWLQAAWAIVLLATQGFARLLAYTTSAMLITGVLTVLAVVVLRVRHPHWARPYRAVLYPWTPLLFSAASLLTIGILAARGDPSVLMAIGWFAAALVAHAGLQRVARAVPPRYS